MGPSGTRGGAEKRKEGPARTTQNPPNAKRAPVGVTGALP